MIVTIGTTNKMKVMAVKKILRKFSNKDNIEIVTQQSKSLVSETPWGEETFIGARNRAINAKSELQASDYYVGLESGLVERYKGVYEEAWCCVISKEAKEFYGYSSGLRIPEYVLKKMDALKLPHYKIMELIQKEDKLKKGDTWGNYSANLISRKVSLEEATRNAFIQVFAPNDSTYMKNGDI